MENKRQGYRIFEARNIRLKAKKGSFEIRSYRVKLGLKHPKQDLKTKLPLKTSPDLSYQRAIANR